MPGPIHWSCRCGTVALDVAEGQGLRGVCYCRHCRAFARHFGAEDGLDPAGGTDLYQTTPDCLHVIRGADRLACLRLTSKGPLRWYAACCGTPLANTATTRNIPFASLMLAPVTDRDAAGPVRARVYTEGATGRLPGRSGGTFAMVGGVLTRALAARLAGRHTETPFFDDAGAPVAQPSRLTPEERAAAYRDG